MLGNCRRPGYYNSRALLCFLRSCMAACSSCVAFPHRPGQSVFSRRPCGAQYVVISPGDRRDAAPFLPLHPCATVGRAPQAWSALVRRPREVSFWSGRAYTDAQQQALVARTETLHRMLRGDGAHGMRSLSILSPSALSRDLVAAAGRLSSLAVLRLKAQVLISTLTACNSDNASFLAASRLAARKLAQDAWDAAGDARPLWTALHLVLCRALRQNSLHASAQAHPPSLCLKWRARGVHATGLLVAPEAPAHGTHFSKPCQPRLARA